MILDYFKLKKNKNKKEHTKKRAEIQLFIIF